MRWLIRGLWLLVLAGCMGKVESHDMYKPDIDLGAASQSVQRSTRGKLMMRASVAGVIQESPTNNEVSLQCDLDGGMNTIQFGMIPKSNPVIFGQVSVAKATILWTVDGNTTQRVVTVGTGVSVSGSAQKVQVVMRDATRVGPGYVAGFDRLYDVSVQVSKGTRPDIQSPPTLIPDSFSSWAEGTVLVNAAASAPTLTVPSNSGVVAFQCVISEANGAPIPAGSFTVRELANGVLRREYDPRDYDAWVSIPPSVDQIQLHNYNAGIQVRASVLYGIDG